jgi:hypothetical protein
MKNHVNLLPMKQRRASLLRTLLPRWCAVWVIAIAVVGGVISLNKRHYAALLADVSNRETVCRPIAAMAAENTQMRQAVGRFGRRETLVGQMRDDRQVLCFLAVVSKSARLCEGKIVVRDLEFRQLPTSPTPTSRTPAAPPTIHPFQSVLTIEGDALDNLAIARFAAALRDAALFQDVVLESSVGKPTADRPMHSFIVRCEM